MAQQIDTSSLKDSGAAPSTVSCASPGNCAIGGTYLDAKNNRQDFVADEARGRWGPAQQVPGVANVGQFPGLFQASCPAAGECVAVGGFETDNSRAFIAEERNGKFGQEQKENITVKVGGRAGGTPGGKVTVLAGARTVCVIKLAGGKGSCKLGAKALKPGHYQLTAAYGGSQTYVGSRSGRKTLVVSK